MEQYQYDIFRTQWGWFGLLGSERGLVRTCLPVAHKEAVQSRLLSDIPNAERSKNAFSALKISIEDYYKGSPADFGNVEVYLGDTSDFQRKVLTTLQTISYGEIVSYSQLAKLAGSPKAARAIGMVMAVSTVLTSSRPFKVTVTRRDHEVRSLPCLSHTECSGS